MNKVEFIKKIYSNKYVNKVINKVKLLGSSNNTDPYDFLISRLISSILIFCICL